MGGGFGIHPPSIADVLIEGILPREAVLKKFCEL